MKAFLVISLSVFSVLLFLFNYLVAEAISPWDINPDENLAVRFNIYATILCSVFILSLLEHNAFSKFVLSVGIGLCVSDVLDRFIFDVTVFQWNDVLMIILTILTSFYKHIYVRKRC